MAKKLINEIKTKHERYVPFEGAKKSSNRTGNNSYIDILDYFKNNY
jgi:hypothetical protein